MALTTRTHILNITGTIGWACLILFVVPDNGDDLIAHIIVAIGAVLALIAMATYLSTACTDPGIVFKHMAPPMSGSLPTVGEAAGSFAAGVEGGGGDPGRGSWGTAVVVRMIKHATSFAVELCSLYAFTLWLTNT